MMLKNRRRFQLEQLEERCTPTFSVTSAAVPDAAGNLNIKLSTTGATFTVQESGVAQVTLTDDTGGSLVVNGVFGNITINATSTTAAANTFLTVFDLNGGVATGNVSFTLARTNTGAGATNWSLNNTSATTGTILGNLSVTINAATASTVNVNNTAPAAGPVSILGNVGLYLQGGTTAHTKTVNIGSGTPANDVTIFGNLNAPNINAMSVGVNSLVTVNGTVTLSTKSTTTASQNVVNFAAVTGTTGAIFGNLSATMGSTAGVGTSSLTLSGTINGFTSINLGATGGTGAYTTTLSNGATFNGNLITIVGGNGNKTINVAGINAGSAKLTVSLGNALSNLVAFTNTNSLVSATLIGGTGINKVTGVVTFPLYLYRFTF